MWVSLHCLPQRLSRKQNGEQNSWDSNQDSDRGCLQVLLSPKPGPLTTTLEDCSSTAERPSCNPPASQPTGTLTRGGLSCISWRAELLSQDRHFQTPVTSECYTCVTDEDKNPWPLPPGLTEGSAGMGLGHKGQGSRVQWSRMYKLKVGSFSALDSSKIQCEPKDREAAQGQAHRGRHSPRGHPGWGRPWT